jgi:hypothetical protein
MSKKVWVVWEPNSIIPRVFLSERRAYEYRKGRANNVRHQVYVQPAELDEGE